MIYTYQDGTELQVQRDFIQDLKNYVECLEKILPLENEIIELKDRENDQTALYERKVMVLSTFKEELNHILPQSTENEETVLLKPCVDEIFDVCNKFIKKYRDEFEVEANRLKKDLNTQMKLKENEIIKSLNPFLISGVYGAKRVYDISYHEVLTGTLYFYASGLQYKYQMYFSDEKLSVQKLLGDFTLPAMFTTGLFSKEQKPRVISLSDYTVLSIQYDDLYNFSLDLENKKRVIRIGRKNGNFSIFDDGRDITADNGIASLLNEAELQQIPKQIMEYLRKNITSFELKEVYIDDEDAIANNSIFDCMKIIAAQYSVVVAECIRRSTIKNEISIKIQTEDGARNEKYISKEELYSSLANIGGDGLEIASIIGADTQNTKKQNSNNNNNKYFIV